MNEKEILGLGFDETLNFLNFIIEKHRWEMRLPKGNNVERIKTLTKLIDQFERIRNDIEMGLKKQEIYYSVILPIFKGYTIDFRLKQFRKTTMDNTLEFVPFNSNKGEALLLLIEEERPDIIEEMIS